MIIVTVDGLNWRYAQEYYFDLFPVQTMKMIKNNVRLYTQQPLQVGWPTAGPTAVGLICMWSGERPKNFHDSIFKAKYDEHNEPYKLMTRDGKKMDLIWDYFDNGKIQFKHQGPNWQDDYKERFKHYYGIKAKRCPSDEMCVFAEASKDDYDLFWIHSAIIKGGVMMPGCYEQGRIPTLMPYDDIRKDKQFKKRVYIFSIRRYKEVIRWLAEIRPNDLFVVSSDHGTMVDLPFTPEQIDNIPLIVNREVDMDGIDYQWQFKDFILKLKDME